MKDTDEIKGAMSRDEMQTEATAIEALLKAAMAVLTSNDRADAYELIDMAQMRAAKLNHALDSLHVEEKTA